MKLLLMMLLLISIQSNAQFTPLAEIEVGYKNINAKIGQDNYWLAANIKKYNMYSNITLGVKNKKLDICINVENNFGYDDGTSFTPKQISYCFSTKYNLNKITFSFEHFCSHPIIAKVSDLYLNNDSYYTTSYDKLTVKYKIL